jgi:hypothetical protein
MRPLVYGRCAPLRVRESCRFSAGSDVAGLTREFLAPELTFSAIPMTTKYALIASRASEPTHERAVEILGGHHPARVFMESSLRPPRRCSGQPTIQELHRLCLRSFSAKSGEYFRICARPLVREGVRLGSLLLPPSGDTVYGHSSSDALSSATCAMTGRAPAPRPRLHAGFGQDRRMRIEREVPFSYAAFYTLPF